MEFTKENMIGVESLERGEIYIMVDDSPAEGGIGVNKFMYFDVCKASFLATLADESDTNWIDQTFHFNDYINKNIFIHVVDASEYPEYDGNFSLSDEEDDSWI